MQSIILFMIVVFVPIFIIVIATQPDDIVRVKSSIAVEKYDYIKYLKENREKIPLIENLLQKKKKYKIQILYVSPAGRKRVSKNIYVDLSTMKYLQANPQIIMTSAEQNKINREQRALDREKEKALKEAQKELEKSLLEGKQHIFYDKVNEIIDLANQYKEGLLTEKDKDELDKLIGKLFERTVHSIKKVKQIESEEWSVIEGYIATVQKDVQNIIDRNQKVLNYYISPEFEQLKNTCSSIMALQKDFNEYIEEKAQSISTMFGARAVRNETVNEDRFNYIRPYQKTITPFTAEVSNAVFSSAENKPIEYIVKYFYPFKSSYPKQIEKLRLLIGELETLKEAKRIIDNYKKDYQQFLTEVPAYIFEYDEDGFYSRLGFANINESILTVEYKFVYTSNGGMAQRFFSVPMTEDVIITLIETLENKLTIESFTQEQRALMTPKLRNHIKERDKYTCKICGNSIYKEPNLLLEVDHIIPVSKGGCTIESNLQTLCWKCNREKSNKIA